MPLSPNKLKAVQTLISKTGKRDDKEEIVLEYTQGRTTSVKEMREAEAADLIAALKGETPNKAHSRAEQMRRKLISMAHEMGWKLESGKIDIGRVNAWCIKYGHLHDRLNAYPYEDLPALLTQFEKMYLEFIEKQ